MTDATKTFNLMGAMTLIAFILFISTASVAFIHQTIDWKEYSAAIGPLLGALLGYWLRGAQSATANS